METKLTPQQIEEAAHQNAYSLLGKIIECQPQLLTLNASHEDGGGDAGKMLNSLYDQLVVLARKYVSA